MTRTPTPFLATLLALAPALALASTPATPSVTEESAPVLAHWPSWRGPAQTGVAPHSDPPTEWSETKNLRWKSPLPGPGHATPVVWGDSIYVLSAVSLASPPAEKPAETPAPQSGDGPPKNPAPTSPHEFTVSALSRADGKTLWQTVVRKEVPHEPGHVTASQASASPVTDGKHVWASFGSRGLYCLEAATGKVVWEKDLGDQKTRNEFGEGTSPVVHRDLVVINWDHEGDSFIVALDKLTGEERWRVAREEPTSWATPLVLQDGERTVVVVSATNHVKAYDLKTGQEIWKVSGLGANVIPTPVADESTLFVMSGYRDPAAMAIRYRGAAGDLTGTDRVAWKVTEGLSYVPSPLLYDGKVYFLERFKGMLSCHDLQTGEVVYTKQRLDGLGSIYASLVGAAGKVYLIDRDGNAVVFRHGKEFAELARNKLDDAFDASPVVVGDELYLRGHRYLYKVAAQ